MFQSYRYIRNPNRKAYSVQTRLEIVDSDFSAQQDVDYSFDAITELLIFVIKEYEERKLPVASNLLLVMLCLKNAIGNDSVSWLINYCNERIPEFAKYKENVEKLMVLI